MDTRNERRLEQRLRYHWPVWYAEDFGEALSQGQMVDVSSGGAAFTCHADESCPYAGQEVTARFSVPCFGSDDAFEMSSYTRSGRVCRVEQVSDYSCRVAMQFAESLPFRPGEQTETEAEAEEKLNSVTI